MCVQHFLDVCRATRTERAGTVSETRTGNRQLLFDLSSGTKLLRLKGKRNVLFFRFVRFLADLKLYLMSADT